MRKGDAQLGRPHILYRNTKDNIEAFTGLIGGETAYATDTGEDGAYDAVAAEWVWGRSGSGTSISILTSDPGSPADGELWLLRETVGAHADGEAMGMLAMTYTGDTGAVAPLQLSVNDDGVTRRITFS